MAKLRERVRRRASSPALCFRLAAKSKPASKRARKGSCNNTHHPRTGSAHGLESGVWAVHAAALLQLPIGSGAKLGAGTCRP